MRPYSNDERLHFIQHDKFKKEASFRGGTGGLGVSPFPFYFPHDWGIQGVDSNSPKALDLHIISLKGMD
jgi:hypothetical protein